MTTPFLTFARPMSVLTRPDGALQVGLDSEVALVLPDAPDGADTALRAFRVPRRTAEVQRLLPSLPPAWVESSTAALVAHGVLRRPASDEASIHVVGTGYMSDAVRRAVVAEGWTALPDLPDDLERASLVVVSPATAEPDRVVLRDLTAAGVPHLVVRTEPERAVVGPFVISGRGPCVHCTDLVRADLDPAFPHLLAQLCRALHAPRPRQTDWSAALVMAQIAGWRAGREPQTRGATIELDAFTGEVGVRPWAQHPACSCALAAL